MTNKDQDRDRFQKRFLLLLLLVVTAVFFRMIARFITPLLLAALLAGMTYPLYLRLVRLARGRTGVAATVTLLAADLVVPDIVSALDLLLKPQRLVASLRC